MGVRGLSTFVDKNPRLLSQHRLHDCKVIIDGNNLLYFLFHHYKVSHVFGGDMDRYARKCKRFFNTLNSCHITPYVVLDGGYAPDDRKLPTHLERMSERRRAVSVICATGRGTILPVLAVETFRQVLVELKIPHAASLFEADREIAVLAKRWECPVMSNDSDFFVYNLPGGFVPFDYVNMTLCVYDEETKTESLLCTDTTVTQNQYVYIPVKLYLCERFYSCYSTNIQLWCLPLLATLLGNDYVDSSKLSNFYATIRVPKCSKRKFFVTKTSTKFITMLHWLDCLEEGRTAIKDVCDKLPKDSRQNMFSKLSQSVMDYYNIEHFTGIDLESFFNHDFGNDACLSANRPKLLDYWQEELPSWFVDRLLRFKMTPTFQNVVVIRHVILQCQVEMLKLPSTYECSRYIRQVIYGILTQNPNNDKEKTGTVIEYDRIVKDTKKIYVEPVSTIPGSIMLPNLHQLQDVSEEDKLKLLLSALGVISTEQVPLSAPADDVSSLILCGVVSYWILHAQPKVTEHHVTSLFMCVLLLHVRALRWLDLKEMLGAKPVRPHLHTDLVAACRNSTDKQVENFLKHMDKHLVKPDHSGKHPRDNKVVHGFSQFQACLLDTLRLKQLLNCQAGSVCPSIMFNGTFVYNLCRDLANRSKPDLFVCEVLGPGSPLHNCFMSLKTKVMDIVKPGYLEPVSVTPGRSKKKKAQKKSEEETGPAAASQASTSREKMKEKSLEVNCQVLNKFSLLSLQEDCGN